MSYCIYSSIIHHRSDFFHLKKKFLLFTYGLPLVLSLIPFTTSNYGPAENIKCWITGDFSGSLHRLLIFFLPLILVLVYSFWTVKKVWRALGAPNDDPLRKKEVARVKNQFLYYPMILALCYFIPLLRIVFELIDTIWDTELGKERTLLIIHYAMGPLQGFFNALVYGTSNKDVKIRLHSLFCWFCKTSSQDDSGKLNISLHGDDESTNIINS